MDRKMGGASFMKGAVSEGKALWKDMEVGGGQAFEVGWKVGEGLKLH